ncbi:hypothetical protein SteCoe_12718 [Stentor coeruleus]|uniref:Uncharacterized protein n=1 Tax=Stentor coeruleus TaxID=5963 RepID=A0A1R2CA40_9CILI|nr:hypothetical protein SteCoe_12718 [Stentor coeruleus]
MLVVYALILVHSFYLLIILITTIVNKRLGTIQRTKTEEVIVTSSVAHTGIETSCSRPSYKKNNLTIEVPDTSMEVEDTESKFIKQYYKVISNIDPMLSSTTF